MTAESQQNTSKGESRSPPVPVDIQGHTNFDDYALAFDDSERNGFSQYMLDDDDLDNQDQREQLEDEYDDELIRSRRRQSVTHSYMDEKHLQSLSAKVSALHLASSAAATVASSSNNNSNTTLPAPLEHVSSSPSSYVVTPGSGSKLHEISAQTSVQAATDDEHPVVIAELKQMYSKVYQCLEMRHKYQEISLQREVDNPKNDPSWNIYPPPPKPSWKEATKEFDNGSRTSLGEIGKDFCFEDCHIPSQDDEMVFSMNSEGVYEVYENEDLRVHNNPIVHVPSLRDYYIDMDKLIEICSNGPVKSFAFKRLQYLEAKWNMYYLLNEYRETAESKKTPHRDFYNVRKVDTHVHHSACMNQKHLLRFIKSKIKKCSNEIVIYRDDKLLTLSEVFESLGLRAYDLSIDTLDMHAHKDTFHRFDKFNLKYNPVGESRLREIFLKTDNYVHGRYLAELTKEVMEDLEASKYQMAEYRISIYGKDLNEWDKLAAWVVDNKLFSNNVRWLIQVPRLYDIYKKTGVVQNFSQMLENIFRPLFEVTQDPSSHPKLFIFLHRVVGFDSVDDESKVDRRVHRKFPPATQWDFTQNPPYSYYLYYLYANIASLNQWRKRRGVNTFVLRPHAGEAGDPEHLIAAFLTSQAINHGILLRKIPFIQYLFFLDHIGIAMSPLSNNALFLTYNKNPFYDYFKRGLNVSLSTDDPLQFSYTREPLIEEYSVAAQIYKLSSVDMCELARNSVLQSGFELPLKKHWVGHNYFDRTLGGNQVEKTNVPEVRLDYREETFFHEHSLMEKYAEKERLPHVH